MSVRSRYFLGYYWAKILCLCFSPGIMVKNIMMVAKTPISQPHSHHRQCHITGRLHYQVITFPDRRTVNAVMMQISGMPAQSSKIYKTLKLIIPADNSTGSNLNVISDDLIFTALGYLNNISANLKICREPAIIVGCVSAHCDLAIYPVKIIKVLTLQQFKKLYLARCTFFIFI